MNEGFKMVQRKQRVGSPLGGKSELPTFLYLCFRINSFCFHFKAQLKYPSFSQKEGRRRRWRKLINIPVQVVLFLDIPGGCLNRGRARKDQGKSQIQSTQGSSTLYCSSREGHQATHWSWQYLIQCGGKKQSTNQSTQTEILLLPKERYSHETVDSTTIYLC